MVQMLWEMFSFIFCTQKAAHFAVETFPIKAHTARHRPRKVVLKWLPCVSHFRWAYWDVEKQRKRLLLSSFCIINSATYIIFKRWRYITWKEVNPRWRLAKCSCTYKCVEGQNWEMENFVIEKGKIIIVEIMKKTTKTWVGAFKGKGAS